MSGEIMPSEAKFIAAYTAMHASASPSEAR